MSVLVCRVSHKCRVCRVSTSVACLSQVSQVWRVSTSVASECKCAQSVQVSQVWRVSASVPSQPSLQQCRVSLHAVLCRVYLVIIRTSKRRPRQHCNTCLPYTLQPTRACLLTQARTRTHSSGRLFGGQDPLSCLFGGRDPMSGVWLRGLGPLRQRQGGSSKTELRERRDSEQRWRRVCVLGCQETERVLGGEETDQQRPPALQPPPGRLPRAPCSRSWPPRVGRG